MRLLKPLCIAFSIYSKIPMPQFEWKEEDMKYMLCFFPWIGTVIGLCLVGWRTLCSCLGAGELCYVLGGAAIPLLVTGGFHVDGFMDTMDAFHSYQTRERKLEILKDSHIGAFAVIMLALYGLLYLGAFSEIRQEKLFWVCCAGFFLSRCLSGLGVVFFSPAKKDGMLWQFAEGSSKKKVRLALTVQAILCVVFMLIQSFWGGLLAAAAALLSMLYYGYRSKKEFGGVTGDTAGYFLLLCELAILAVLAAWNLMGIG